MQKLLPALLAEAIGVFGLSFVGIMAIFQLKDAGPAGLIGVALAHGLMLAIMISIFAAASGGHINPAVTIGLLIGGKIKPAPALAYIIAQVLGGMAAGYAILAMFPHTQALSVIVGGTPALARDAAGQPVLTAAAGAFAEMITTFFLVTAVWGTAVDPRAPKIGGFGIGLTVAADILAIGPLTGAAMNPARATGPVLAALMAGDHNYDWAHHWIYWVGPVAGGVIASLIYRGWIYPAGED